MRAKGMRRLDARTCRSASSSLDCMTPSCSSSAAIAAVAWLEARCATAGDGASSGGVEGALDGAAGAAAGEKALDGAAVAKLRRSFKC